MGLGRRIPPDPEEMILRRLRRPEPHHDAAERILRSLHTMQITDLDRAVQKKHLTLKTKETYVQYDSVYGGNRFNPCISFRCQSCSESFSGYEMDQPWVNPADLQAAIEGRWPRNEPSTSLPQQGGQLKQKAFTIFGVAVTLAMVTTIVVGGTMRAAAAATARPRFEIIYNENIGGLLNTRAVVIHDSEAGEEVICFADIDGGLNVSTPLSCIRSGRSW